MNRVSKNARSWLTTLLAAVTLATCVSLLPQTGVADSNTIAATTALNVRQEPSTSSRILGVLATGEQVQRRGDPKGEWTPVVYKGQNAWVFSAYVRFAGNTAAPGGTAKATTYVHVRQGASTMTQSYGVLATGESVEVIGDPKGSWIPVRWKGKEGWVYGAYLSSDGSTATPPPASGDSSDSTNSGSNLTATGTVKATDYVNIRSGPGTNYRIFAVLGLGKTVEARGASTNGWTPVIWNGNEAWICSDYLTDGNSSSGGAATPTTSTAYTTTYVNLRTGPALSYQVVRVLPTNTELALTGVKQGDWSQVSDNGTIRWISSLYISDKKVAVNTGSGSGASNGSNGSGAQGAVNFALAQVGKDYAWGGNGPNAYDCSGLIVAAYKSVGIYLPRTSYAQANAGYAVSYANMQPGDVIISYGGGHASMYIGNGQVVHAVDYGIGIITGPVPNGITAIRRVV